MLRLRGWKSSLAFLMICLLSLAAVILPGTMMSPSLAQSSFKDVQAHWAQPCIDNLAQRRIINGYPDGTFRPDAPITRAEFAGLISTIFTDTAAATRDAIQFVDVPTGYWAHDAIDAAYQTKFLSGYPGKRFQPTQPISRVQVLVALASGLNYTPKQPAINTLNVLFDDAQSIPGYAQNGIAAAAEKGLVVNYPNVKMLEPNRSATRAEVAAFFCRAVSQPGETSLIPLSQVALPRATDAATEIRGVWLTNIDSSVLFSGDRLTPALERLAQLNFNTVYPTVWNWGYTLYPSAIAEQTIGEKQHLIPNIEPKEDDDWLKAIVPADWDMLAATVKQGHELGMSVIPWFEFSFMAPADSVLAERYPDWLTRRRDGSQVIMEGEHARVWLNPMHPEVQQFIISLIQEIVTNYDVDGIQFDDHFGLPVEFGYDAFTTELYQQEHDGQLPPDDVHDPDWMRWRADKLTKVWTQIFHTVKASNPKCLVNWDNEAIWAAVSGPGRTQFKHYPVKARIGISRALINANVPWE
ncbi:MAG: family 10 glycosylhydrolase, partial [Cyanothece sp. SIO1E1]|nr:family 10 glycosylhydrolase [Cyanothece sp. SIO1E1]